MIRLQRILASLTPPLLLLSAAAARASDKVFVEEAVGSGASQSDLQTATELVKSAVPEVSSDTVVEDALKADLKLRPKLIKLGEAYILSMQRVSKEDEVQFSSQLKAAALDELDKIAQRLTRSVLLGERAKENPRVGEITDQEAKDGSQRRATRKAVYLGFGGALFSNLNSSGIGYSFGAAYAWDINTVLLKLQSEGDFNGAAFFLSGGLGVNYYFATTDIAPYVGGDFGIGGAKIDGGGIFNGPTVGGFVAGAAAGVQFFRTASVNLDLGFRAGFLLNSNPLGLPQAYILRLGLYF